MGNQPYRSGTTWLTDDQLLLLDVMFDGGASLWTLRRQHFLEHWTLGYVHSLDDASLEWNVRLLCEHGVLEPRRDGAQTWFAMSPGGGELWSRERCPVWERYCTERYKTTVRGETLMSVRAVSPEVRDRFLALWPENPARCKTAVIADLPLIEWHPFPRLYVGMAIYDELAIYDKHRQCSAEGIRQHCAMLERERCWWRSVSELQKFVAGHAQSSAATDLPGT